MCVPVVGGRAPRANSAPVTAACSLQQPILVVAERASARQEAHPFGGFDAEAATPAGDHIDDQLRVLPRLELRPGDPYRHAFWLDCSRRRGRQAECLGHRRGIRRRGNTSATTRRSIRRTGGTSARRVAPAAAASRSAAASVISARAVPGHESLSANVSLCARFRDSSTQAHVRRHTIRRSPAPCSSRTPAGSWSAGSGRASSCGSPGRCRTACSRRTPRARGRRGSSWSTPGPP